MARKDGNELVKVLERLGACPEARMWARGRPVSRETWEALGDPNWMAWLARRLFLKTFVDDALVELVEEWAGTAGRGELVDWETSVRNHLGAYVAGGSNYHAVMVVHMVERTLPRGRTMAVLKAHLPFAFFESPLRTELLRTVEA